MIFNAALVFALAYADGIRHPWMPAWMHGKIPRTSEKSPGPAEKEVKYFLVKTKNFNCKNQALEYITDVDECIAAGMELGVTNTDRPSMGKKQQEYCGTSGMMDQLTFNMKGGEKLLHYATEDKYIICKEKKSPFKDELCGRELCVPDALKTDDPQKFDLSRVVWEWFGAGAYIGHIPGEPFRDGVKLFNMTKAYTPHFHKHTNFHCGWILHGAKKTFLLEESEHDPKTLKPIGTYFAVDEEIWHSEKLEAEQAVIYLRFVDFMDYVWPDMGNKKYIKTPEESGFDYGRQDPCNRWNYKKKACKKSKKMPEGSVCKFKKSGMCVESGNLYCKQQEDGRTCEMVTANLGERGSCYWKNGKCKFKAAPSNSAWE